VIVPHSRENHNNLIQTHDCTTQKRKSQLLSTDTCLYHTVETFTTTKYRYLIVPHSRENHNYLVHTRDCTTQQKQYNHNYLVQTRDCTTQQTITTT